MCAGQAAAEEQHSPEIVDEEVVELGHARAELPPLWQHGQVRAVGPQHAAVRLHHDGQVERREDLCAGGGNARRRTVRGEGGDEAVGARLHPGVGAREFRTRRSDKGGGRTPRPPRPLPRALPSLHARASSRQRGVLTLSHSSGARLSTASPMTWSVSRRNSSSTSMALPVPRMASSLTKRRSVAPLAMGMMSSRMSVRSAGPMSSRCFCQSAPSAVTSPVPRMGRKGL